MTRDEILKLEAGREMDALIAEKVMGWERREWNHTTGVFFWFDTQKQTGSGWLERDAPNDWNGYLFRPSEDIAAANEVVNKFDVFEIQKYKDCIGTTFYYAYANSIEEMGEVSSTFPLAICRAALLAVMETE
jgi:hypothetical protein